MEPRSRAWRFTTCLFLGLLLLATTLQSVQGEEESEAPSQCRPFIEKALKEQQKEEAPAGQEDTIPVADDDSEHGESEHDTDSIETEQANEEAGVSTEVEQSETENQQDEEQENVEVQDEIEQPEEEMQGDQPAEEIPEGGESVEGTEDEAETKEESVETQTESEEPKEESAEPKEESEEPKVESVEATAESEEPKEESVEAKEESVEAKEESVEAKEESVEAKEESVEAKEESEEPKEESVEAKEESIEATTESEEPKEESIESAPEEQADEAQSQEKDSQEGDLPDVASAETKEAESTEQAEQTEATEEETGSVEKTEETETTPEEPTESTEQSVEAAESTEATTTESEEPSQDDTEAKSAETEEEPKEEEQIEQSVEEQSEVKESVEEVSEQQETQSIEETSEGELQQEPQAEESKEGEDTQSQEAAKQEVKEEQSEKPKEEAEEPQETEAEAPAQEEASKEAVPEEDLILDIEIPEDLRPRDHVDQLLKLDVTNDQGETIINKVNDLTLKELKKLYENAIKPLETLYKYRDLSNRHFGDSEIFSKPLVVFMGPWSGGKSSIVNYLLDNEYNATSLRTGAEPSPAYFNLVMHGNEPEVLDGTQLAADFTFAGLQKFGQGLEERLRGLKLPNKLLEKINIVEIPGILEVRKQVSRVFPFNDACQWFIDRADIIFLVYDPSKLDVGPETEAILDQLKGREHQTRIVLNKADQVKPEELMRVQSALIWNISPLMSSAQPPVMYTTSLWSRPYETWAPVRLLQAQERAFLRDLRSAVDKRIESKIASARRFAVRVRNHAKMVDCYLTTYYNHKSVFGNKKQVADQIIEHPQDYHIYEGLSTLTNISRYDLPDPEVYRDFFRLNPLYDFQQLSATCTYFRGCPINRLDVAIAYDLPELVGKHKKQVETALAAIKPSDHS